MSASLITAGRRDKQRPLFGDSAVVLLAFACMSAIAVNAVLIQTVVTDPSSPLKNIVRGAIFALASFAVVLHRTSVPRSLVLMTFLSAFLLVLRSNPDQLSFLFVFAMVPLLWSMPERKMYRILMFASLLSLALIFAFLAIGVTHNVVIQIRDRSTFGTQGVPFFFNVVYGAATMSVLYCFRYRIRGRFWVVFISLLATTYLFRATDARGGYFSFLIFIAMLAIVPWVARSAMFRALVASMPAIFLGISFLIARFSGDPEINEFMSNRPFLLHTFLTNIDLRDVILSTSVKEFGNVVSSVTNVDNSFLHLLVGGGILTTIFYISMFMKSVFHLFDAKRYSELAFLISTCAYFNSESILLRIENIFVVLSWYLVLRYGIRPAEIDAPTDDEAVRS